MPIELRKSYDFVTYAPTQLGGLHRSMKVEAIMDAATAQTLRDVEGIHDSILPILPPGTPSRTSDLVFYKFRTLQNDMVVLADAWIDQTSVQEVTTITIQATIYNASSADIQRVREAISLLNFTSFDVTTI